jgi:uncharacterized protein YwgA
MASRDIGIDEKIKHWLPLAIIDLSPNGRVEGRKRLQKLVFLSMVEGHLGEYFKFEPHHFGPYSSDLQESLTHMNIHGYVEESKTEIEGLSPRRDYTITDQGRERLVELESDDSIPKRKEKLMKVIENYSEMTTPEILTHVYGVYMPPSFIEPEMINTKIDTLEKNLERYRLFWSSLEKEYYPLSVYILAIYDQISFVIDSHDELEKLDAHILCGAAFDLLSTSKDLLHQVEMYGCGTDEERPPGVQAALEEIKDILVYFEAYSEARGVLISLEDIVISDHTTEKERKAIKRKMKKELQRII